MLARIGNIFILMIFLLVITRCKTDRPPECNFNLPTNCISENSFKINFYETRYSAINSKFQNLLIKNTSDEGFLVAYHTIHKISKSGTVEWSKKFNIRCISELMNDKVICITEEGIVVIIDSNGDEKLVLGLDDYIEYKKAKIETIDSNHAVIFDKEKMIKLDINGNVLLNKKLPFTNDSVLASDFEYYSLRKDKSKTYFIPLFKKGSNRKLVNFNLYNSDFELVKTVKIDSIFPADIVNGFRNFEVIDENTLVIVTNNKIYSINLSSGINWQISNQNYHLIQKLNDNMFVLYKKEVNTIYQKFIHKDGKELDNGEVIDRTRYSSVPELLATCALDSKGNSMILTSNLACGYFDPKKSFCLQFWKFDTNKENCD